MSYLHTSLGKSVLIICLSDLAVRVRLTHSPLGVPKCPIRTCYAVVRCVMANKWNAKELQSTERLV
jgi:hypothetical protein